MNLISTPRPLIVSKELEEGFGEDAYSVGVSSRSVYMGVFDGLGDPEEKQYSCFKNHTGAWLSPRLLACATEMFFHDYKGGFDKNAKKKLRGMMADSLARAAAAADRAEKRAQKKNGRGYDAAADETAGSANIFASVAAAVFIDDTSGGDLSATFLWAGDARGYYLDNKGLCQMTRDDIDESSEDAFLSLLMESELTNYPNTDEKFILHGRNIKLSVPTVVIAATNSCFSCFRSPMDFEYMLLDTLINSDTPAEWKDKIGKSIREVAEDDHIMTLGLFGFSDFEQVKGYFTMRYRFLKEKFIDSMEEFDPMDLWNEYKDNYYRAGL